MAELHDLFEAGQALGGRGLCYIRAVEASALVQDDFSRTRPFLRYAGGKRWLAADLAAEIIEKKPKLYVEPFLGGGAVALALPMGLPKILSDINPCLIDVWRCFQKIPGMFYSELQSVWETYAHTKDDYLRARADFNALIADPRPLSVRRSALFLYLNAHSFNGLWRTNRRGAYNVPFGDVKIPRSYTADEVSGYSLVLSCCDLSSEGFSKVLGDLFTRHANKTQGVLQKLRVMLEGVAVYADPPYDQTFDGYAKSGFDGQAQADLAGRLYSLAMAGAAVWTTNADTPWVREAYRWAQIEEIDERHSVGSKPERRGKRGCLLIRGGAACR